MSDLAGGRRTYGQATPADATMTGSLLQRPWSSILRPPRSPVHLHGVRYISQQALDQRYGEKIKRRLKEEGAADISELKKRLKKDEKPFTPEVHHTLKASADLGKKQSPVKPPSVRQDNSPIRPLSSILNLDKIFETPHTQEQVAALWNARHTSKPGCLSAVIQVDQYQKLIDIARKYPSFVLPLPREQLDGSTPTGGAETTHRPYEFYFLEWNFFDRPPDPRDVPQFPFDKRPETSSNRAPNPPKSVLLFTPLAEYKLHNSYATSHLTLTNYTDLVQSHGIVLMRGDITPNESNPSKLRMKIMDAQILALAMQKFYLERGSERGLEVLARFHEKPEEFRWEELIQICDFKGAT